MIHPVLVVPTERVTGWDGASHGVIAHSVYPLDVALSTEWPTDALLCRYFVVDASGSVEPAIPRINKNGGALAALAAHGARIGFGCAVVDVDAPKPIAQDPAALDAWHHAQRQIVWSVPWLARSARYDTRGGYRIVWSLPAVIWDPGEYERFDRSLRAMLKAHGIQADDATGDWTRLFRLPRVPRYKDLRDRSCLHELCDLPFWPPAVEVKAEMAGIAGAGRGFEVPGAILEGRRNDTMVRMAGSLRSKGFGFEAVLGALRAENDRLCDPPLPDAEIVSICKWVMKFDAPDVAAQANTAAGPSGPSGAPAAPPARMEAPQALLIHEGGKPKLVRQDTEKAIGPRIFHGSQVEMAHVVLADMENGGHPFTFDRGEMWRYEPTSGVWLKVNKFEGEAWCRNLDRELVPASKTASNPSGLSPLKVSQAMVQDLWKMARHIRADVDFFNRAPRGIAFSNGFLPMDGTLTPHSPHHKARAALAFPYEPGARAPRWEQALSEWLKPCGPDWPRVASMLAEFVGACLFGFVTDYETAIVLFGDRAANGKSQFLNVIGELFAGEAKAAIPPQLMDDMNARAKLDGVRLNIVSEMPDGEILKSGAWKAAVSGEWMEARSVYKEGFHFRPSAGHIMAANRLPAVKDTTRGFWRRWRVVPFHATFRPGDAGFVPQLSQRIINEEMPGVAMWAVEGAYRLRAREGFETPGACQEALEHWRLSADQIAAFLHESCTTPVEPGKPWIVATELFNVYTQWVARNKGQSVSQRTFGVRMRELGFVPAYHADGTYYPVTVKAEFANLRRMVF